MAASSFSAEVGGRIDVAELRRYLARMGFTQAPTVTEPGEFAIRGGLIDLYPPGARGRCGSTCSATCWRSARRFDPETQRTTEAVKRVELAPVSEVLLDEPAIERFRTRLPRAMFGAAGRDDPLYEAVSAGRKHQGYEHWLPFFHERLETLFDYLPGAPVVARRPDRGGARGALGGAARAVRRAGGALAAKSKLGTVYKPVPPGELYLDEPAGTRGDGRRGRCTSFACCRSRSGRA